MIVDIENMTWSPIHVTQRLQDHQKATIVLFSLEVLQAV